MSWLYSRALVEEYSEECSSDGEPSAPLKSNHIPQAFCASDRMTAFSRLSRYGMTFAPLTESHGEGLLTLYLAGFPAKISAPPEREQASRASALVSGKNTPGLLAKYDRASSLWKTVQSSLFEDSEPSSVIFPRWGMTRNGVLYQQPTPAHPTEGRESGLWPTPQTRGFTNDGDLDALAAKAVSFEEMSAMAYRASHKKKAAHWPTPRTAGMCGGTGNWNQLKEKCSDIEEARKMGAGNGGQLNPTWVEWLMGWPLNWTSLDPLDKEEYDYWHESQFGKKEGAARDPSHQMRNVWWDKDPSETSQGRESDEQFNKEYNCSMPEMPYKNTLIERDMGERSDKPGAMQNMRRDIPTNQKPPREVVREAGMSNRKRETVGRIAMGVKARVDRLKAIGNGQVPAVVRLAWDYLVSR